ncbi:hypothetical protein QFZ54_003842 [Sphingomonas faeni]|nr:hypothetical protein [Sphingomonas faeni]
MKTQVAVSRGTGSSSTALGSSIFHNPNFDKLL